MALIAEINRGRTRQKFDEFDLVTQEEVTRLLEFVGFAYRELRRIGPEIGTTLRGLTSLEIPSRL